MAKKNIVDALEGISDAISGGGGGSVSGGSGNSGLGFTLVYYDPANEQSTSLMAIKNGNLVPFTVTDLVGQTPQDAIKTVPILFVPPANDNPSSFICNMTVIAQQSGITMLGFSLPNNKKKLLFIASEDSNYAFVSPLDSDDDNDNDPLFH